MNGLSQERKCAESARQTWVPCCYCWERARIRPQGGGSGKDDVDKINTLESKIFVPEWKMKEDPWFWEYGYNCVLVLTSGIVQTCHFCSHRKLEWGTEPRKGRGKQRGWKQILVWTWGLGEKGETVGNMEVYGQKKRYRRERKKEIERKSYCWSPKKETRSVTESKMHAAIRVVWKRLIYISHTMTAT